MGRRYITGTYIVKKTLKCYMMIFACVALLSACGEKDTTPADTPSGGEENPVETPSKRVKQIVLSQEGSNDKVWDFAWEGNLLKSIS